MAEVALLLTLLSFGRPVNSRNAVIILETFSLPARSEYNNCTLVLTFDNSTLVALQLGG